MKLNERDLPKPIDYERRDGKVKKYVIVPGKNGICLNAVKENKERDRELR